MDITTSLKMDVNRHRVRADKDREVYWSEARGNRDEYRKSCITWKNP